MHTHLIRCNVLLHLLIIDLKVNASKSLTKSYCRAHNDATGKSMYILVAHNFVFNVPFSALNGFLLYVHVHDAY